MHGNNMAESILIFALLLSLFSVLGDVINPECHPVGTKNITISWKFTPASPGKLPRVFNVFFCKNGRCSNASVNYKAGCAVNVTEEKSEYSCNIGKALELKFPKEYRFYFYVKEDNGVPLIRRCPVNMEIQCSKPTGMKLQPSGRKRLMLSWSKPTDMGESTDLLCYHITYFDKENPDKKYYEEYEDSGHFQYEIKSLLASKTYYVLLTCALTCPQRKSVAAGPVSAMTLEEEPQDRVRFQDWFMTPIDDYQRNITVILEIPDKAKWNGKVRKIRVFCYKDDLLCTNITLELNPNGLYNVTFPSLRKDTSYYIDADYCNNVACSPKSRNITIPPLPIAKHKYPEAVQEEGLTTVQVVVIAVVCALVILIPIIVVVIIKKCNAGCHTHENLAERVGPLSSNDGGPHEDEVPEDPAHDSAYSRADWPVPRTATLNPETTDFHSASVRSINSSNLIGGLTDQSSVNDNSSSIRHDENGETNVMLQRFGSPSAENRLDQDHDSLLPTPV